METIVKIDDVEIYDNDIERAMSDACARFGIEDLRKERQRPWKAVLQYVGKNVFPDRNVLKSHDNIYNPSNSIPSNYNKYNTDIIILLCDYYIYISNLYDKFVSTEGFSYFVNIPKDTIDNWKHSELGSSSFRIWKKLQDIRLESIKDDALDNGNVTGTMFVGNTEYGLNLPGVSKEPAGKRAALSIDDLPQIGQYAQIPQIKQTERQDIVVGE